MAGIFYLDYYLPNNFVTVKDVLDKNPYFVLPQNYNSLDDYCKDYCNETKLDKISFENKYDMAEIFSELYVRFFETEKIDPAQISHQIYIDEIPNEFGLAYYLHKKFGMVNATNLKVDHSCVSSIISLDIFGNYLAQNKDDADKIVVLLSSNIFKTLEDHFSPYTVCGDAAGIIALKNKPVEFEILDCVSRADGLFSYNAYHKVEQMAFNQLLTYRKGIKTIDELLKRNQLTMEDIRVIIPQNVNHFLNVTIANMLKVPFDKVFTNNLSNGGHLGDVDIIRNFKDCLNSYSISEGELILLYGLGAAYQQNFNFDAMLLRCCTNKYQQACGIN